ncbi:caspase-like isoform X2 [Aricia agestis]|nr:caspase-like isoform X2 [Aricia agestis]
MAPSDRNYDVGKELLYYDASGTKHLYIFNHKEYEKTKYFGYSPPPSRNGTEEDVRRLSSVFQKLNYETHVNNDLKYDEIMDTMSNISKEDHTSTSYLCFAVLTHGGQGGELHAADRRYQLQDLMSLLATGHPSLLGKPKIFFIQACRGKHHDSGRRLALDGTAAVTISSFADFLVLTSSVEDYVSYRSINGSFMIQELCDVVEQHHQTLDILQLTTLVHRNVCYERAAYAPRNRTMHGGKQMPETRHTLTKILML